MPGNGPLIKADSIKDRTYDLSYFKHARDGSDVRWIPSEVGLHVRLGHGRRLGRHLGDNDRLPPLQWKDRQKSATASTKKEHLCKQMYAEQDLLKREGRLNLQMSLERGNARQKSQDHGVGSIMIHDPWKRNCPDRGWSWACHSPPFSSTGPSLPRGPKWGRIKTEDC